MLTRILIASVLALGGSSISLPAQVKLHVGVGGGVSVQAGVSFGKTSHGPAWRRLAHRGRRAPHQVRVQVWVPGYHRRVFVPARYAWRYDSCRRRVRYCVARACYRNVWQPGHWEYRARQVRVGGRRRYR